MAELVFVKLGGSVITDKMQPNTPRPEVIRRLAGEVKAARSARPDLQILLGHGSGSFGHVVGQKYQVHKGIAGGGDWWGYAETGAVAGRLHRIVADVFIQVGVPVVSIQPSASARCHEGRLVAMETYPIVEALQHGLVPLVYGDVAFDDVQGCAILSTEVEFAYLARRLAPSRVVLVGEVDGVYDGDPMTHPGARRIPRITPAMLSRIEDRLGNSHGIDVTGGMLSKVREMAALVEQDCARRVQLLSGLCEGALTRALLGADTGEGTVIER